MRSCPNYPPHPPQDIHVVQGRGPAFISSPLSPIYLADRSRRHDAVARWLYTGHGHDIERSGPPSRGGRFENSGNGVIVTKSEWVLKAGWSPHRPSAMNRTRSSWAWEHDGLPRPPHKFLITSQLRSPPQGSLRIRSVCLGPHYRLGTSVLDRFRFLGYGYRK